MQIRCLTDRIIRALCFFSSSRKDSLKDYKIFIFLFFLIPFLIESRTVNFPSVALISLDDIESMLESIPVLQSRDFLHILIYFLSSCDKYENIYSMR